MAQRHDILISIAPVSPFTSLDGQCAGITKSGSRCKRVVKGKAYCHSHNLQLTKAGPTSAAEVPITTNEITAKIPDLLPDGYYQCTGISKTGYRCKSQVKEKTYCHYHDKQHLKPNTTTQDPKTDPTSSAAESEAPLTVNNIISRIPNLLPSGYYQCAGISKNGSRCKWHVKDNAYCLFHDTQLLEAISHRHADKDVVVRMITQVRSHRSKGPYTRGSTLLNSHSPPQSKLGTNPHLQLL